MTVTQKRFKVLALTVVSKTQIIIVLMYIYKRYGWNIYFFIKPAYD